MVAESPVVGHVRAVGRQAVLVGRVRQLDWDALEAWAESEGARATLAEFRHLSAGSDDQPPT